MRDTFCFLCGRPRHGLRRLGGGAGPGVVLWRSRADRGASQPADGIAGQGPQSRQRPVRDRQDRRSRAVHPRQNHRRFDGGRRDARLPGRRAGPRKDRAHFRRNPGGQRRAFAAGGAGVRQTSSSAICSYGADRVEHLQTNPVGDRTAPLSGDALGCETFRLPLVQLAESTDDLAPVAAALAKVGSGGVERAESIPVNGVADRADMEAAERIPVGALGETLQRKAPATRSASLALRRPAKERSGRALRTSCIRSSQTFAGSSISAPGLP